MKFLVVGNPENRRVRLFESAAENRGHRCRVVSWLETLRQGVPDPADSVVRIDSPGENREVERALIRRGRLLRGADPDDWDDVEDHGRIRAIGDVHRGFVDVLSEFPANGRYVNTPAAIAAMFDKVETKERLRTVGVTVPRTFGRIRTFDALDEVLSDAGASRAFVKPRHGSSASGVIALSRRPGRVAATTSIEIEEDRLYNSLRIRRYRELNRVCRLVDLLGREDELLVEEWIPKASAQKGTFDLRLVPIGEGCEHAVMRLSQHPMTNLHLGNARGDLAALRADLGEESWDEIRAVARRSAAAFEGAFYAGVDIAVTTGRRHIVVFEVNAFGDLLPGIADSRGHDTYEATIDAFVGSEDAPV